MSFTNKPDHSNQQSPEDSGELDKSDEIGAVHAAVFSNHAMEESGGKIAGKPPIGL